LLGHGEQSPGPKQRVSLATTVSERLVLDPSSTLVELGVGVFHDVERTGNECCIWQRCDERRTEGC